MLLAIPLLPFLAIGGIVWLIAKGSSGEWSFGAELHRSTIAEV